jgi:hypothetical protein
MKYVSRDLETRSDFIKTQVRAVTKFNILTVQSIETEVIIVDNHLQTMLWHFWATLLLCGDRITLYCTISTKIVFHRMVTT